ncbi:uncharacterized protein LOC115583250 isoform X2 [Sparus aurata]|uniref:uncharacterized protein LOC115583250 isoform X2 n=1 Tax=Sparus aurata TaxID=8175 RepID=UPI0011C17F89|nr:uncharacterized protein LOC115583250 isoform X2 [Sparus aurata]
MLCTLLHQTELISFSVCTIKTQYCIKDFFFGKSSLMNEKAEKQISHVCSLDLFQCVNVNIFPPFFPNKRGLQDLLCLCLVEDLQLFFCSLTSLPAISAQVCNTFSGKQAPVQFFPPQKSAKLIVYAAVFTCMFVSWCLYLLLLCFTCCQQQDSGAPKPIITILDATKDWALLQCVVRGASPKPKVEWQDSSGNVWETAEDHQVSERRGSFYVTLNTNVTRTDRYRCNVTQEEISHQTKAETFVFINVNPSSVSGKLCEDPSSKVVIGWLFGIVIGAVVLAAVQFGLVASKRITVTCNRGAAPEPTTTSNDLTKDTPLLQVGVTVDHQHQNGSSKAPPETPPL